MSNVFTLEKWDAIAIWKISNDETVCGICREEITDLCGTQCLHDENTSKVDPTNCIHVFCQNPGNIKHAFHAHCVNRWIDEHHSCPTCRKAWE